MSYATGSGRSPAFKLLLALIVAAALAVPTLAVWALVYDRQSQSREASESIAEGWGGPQSVAGPILVIPYRAIATKTVVEGGERITRTHQIDRRFALSPEEVELTTLIDPERRRRSIHEAVVYDANLSGTARFRLPADLSRHGVDPEMLDLSRAELRFSVSDPRGLGSSPRVAVGGRPLRLQPGGGSDGGPGFFAWIDASAIPSRPLLVEFDYRIRGNAAIALAPNAGRTRWTVQSSWPHPSFGGDFLPDRRKLGDGGFTADYRIGNLALGQSLVATGDPGRSNGRSRPPAGVEAATGVGPSPLASVSLVQPVDLYSQVNRATKYGFLFIGFTFLALLMFDVVAGVRVSAVEYLLMGAALILFFVLLLALAEVIGFAPAYLVASMAVSGLNTAYSAAVLDSWRRALAIGGLLAGLYALLYILLSLEALSLLIGSLLLFAALAAVMYATRRIDWNARIEPPR